ncbi:uncharacterized protein [Miscanthus floridulus]|uniref:uncharacterized protein n=1 Tax=Miscanthus floridulus TaxID=154761 RepID=UPI00345AFCEB
MDEGNDLNIMYAKTLNKMGIDRTCLRPTQAPFYGIVLEKTKTLTFKVVGFPGTFHAILGCPCYAKFKVIPNYTYLKLKMLGPRGIITVGTSFQRAYECEVECGGHATVIVASGELAALKEEVTEEAPDAKKSTGSFE